MNHQRKSKNHSLVRDSQLHVPPPVTHAKRWLQITAVVMALAVGAMIVERLTRPTGPVDSKPFAVVNSSGQGEGLVLPPPVQPTKDELVAEADRLADEVATSFPNDPHALAVSGRVSFMLGSPAKAQQRWEQSVALDSKLANAWLGLAELARKQDDFEKAVEYMQRLAEVAPATAREKVFLRVDCLLKMGQAQEAVDVLEEISKIAPLPDWAHVMLGEGYYRLKQYERSAEHYRRGLEDPQQTSVAHYGLSQALLRLGRQEEAQKFREEYARVQEQNLVRFDRMKHAGTDKERSDPAHWYPILAQFHCEAGRLYARREQWEPAQQHWLRASALAPDRPEPRQLLESLVRQ